MMAGVIGLSSWRFILINVVSAMCWAPAYLLPGYLIGTASQALPADFALKLLLLTLSLLFLFWYLLRCVDSLLQWKFGLLDRVLEALHRYFESHPWFARPTKNTLGDLPRGHWQLGLLVFSIVSLAFFIHVAHEVRHTADFSGSSTNPVTIFMVRFAFWVSTVGC